MRDDTGNLFYSLGSPSTSITDDELRSAIGGFLESQGERNDVLILPPDFTRFHSRSGLITQYISEYYNFTPSSSPRDEDGIVAPPSYARSGSSPTSIEIIPALGTHAPMSHDQIEKMFGRSLATKDPSPFVVHNWREDVVTIGHAPAEMVSKATHGMVCEPWPAQINKKVWERRLENHDGKEGPPPLVISVGQVVPHEVLVCTSSYSAIQILGLSMLLTSREWPTSTRSVYGRSAAQPAPMIKSDTESLPQRTCLLAWEASRQ